MADVIDLIKADHRHIIIWQAELDALGRGGDPGRRRALGSTWETVACLIGLHAAAEDEVLALPMRSAGIRDPGRAGEAGDAHDVWEIIREASLQPPGTPLWWSLATAALSSWTTQVDRQERRILPEFARRISAAQRERLCRQWRAFTEAQIRDQIPHTLPSAATCHILRNNPPSGVPRVASVAFDPIYCTCPDCERKLAGWAPSSRASGTSPCRHTAGD